MHSYVSESNEAYAANLYLHVCSDVKYVHILFSVDLNFMLALKTEFEISSSAESAPPFPGHWYDAPGQALPWLGEIRKSLLEERQHQDHPILVGNFLHYLFVSVLFILPHSLKHLSWVCFSLTVQNSIRKSLGQHLSHYPLLQIHWVCLLFMSSFVRKKHHRQLDLK